MAVDTRDRERGLDVARDAQVDTRAETAIEVDLLAGSEDRGDDAARVVARPGLRGHVDGERDEAGLARRKVELQTVGAALEVHPATDVDRLDAGLEQAEVAGVVVEGICGEHRERLR